ncbi:winged helix DNA-binding domain-containing protein [Micromonospora rubida]|uniref:winged helix DNA-binding domain-containing protein n=1 Tax=Micromonospora rubida TaxID=2697657 RepID=UPI001376FB35|nr:winged helix DNA-binding domain-containing protein [Micromonospora rubida]NBE81731.1 winged helix DNA-binding domain-containing protein [Micromonospora rubida]
MTTLDARALNRATLARQFLLERTDTTVLSMVAQLGGLQAQEPQEPFVGLWSRMNGFDPEELTRLLDQRALVRLHLMRRTMHLVTADDAWNWRPRHHALLRQRTLGTYRRELTGLDLDDLAVRAQALMADGQARSLGDVGRALAGHRPGPAPRVLGEAVVAALVPTVQIPPRGTWRSTAGALYLPLSTWLGRPAPPDAGRADPAGEDLVRRYLRAFGPAAGADLRAWCGLAGLPQAVTAIRDELISFRDHRGRELLDLPDAPRPEPDTPAPVRLLPAFDNVVLGYHDRSRIIDDSHRGLSVAGERLVLVDGRVAATWAGTAGTISVTPLRDFTRAERTAVAQEADRLATFLSGTARDRP